MQSSQQSETQPDCPEFLSHTCITDLIFVQHKALDTAAVMNVEGRGKMSCSLVKHSLLGEQLVFSGRKFPLDSVKCILRQWYPCSVYY